MISINSFFYDFKSKIEELYGYEKERFVNIFWQKIYNMSCPIISRTDKKVIFLVRNRYDQVKIVADFNGWNEGESLNRINETDISYLSKTFPAKAAIEYKYKIGNNYYLDSMNKNKSSGYFGENSLLLMPHYKRNEELDYIGGLSGELVDFIIQSKYLGYYKQINVYIPANYSNESKYDTLIFLDGENYLNYGNMVTILDNLIFKKSIKPVIAFFVETKNFKNEFLFNDNHARFFQEEFISFATEKFRLSNKKAIIGNDCAGIGILNILSKYPYFDAILQSVPLYAYKDEIFNIFSKTNNCNSDIFIQNGDYEPPNTEEQIKNNSFVLELLSSKFNSIYSNTFPEGHCWNNWSNHIIDAIKEWDLK